MNFIGIPAHHKMDGLACGKVRLIDQLQRLPVRRGLAEAVEHRPAPCGKIQGKGRGICRIFTVEGSCKAAHPHLSAVTQGSQAGAQAVQGVPAVQPAALQVAGTHSQRPGREVHEPLPGRLLSGLNFAGATK